MIINSNSFFKLIGQIVLDFDNYYKIIDSQLMALRKELYQKFFDLIEKEKEELQRLLKEGYSEERIAKAISSDFSIKTPAINPKLLPLARIAKNAVSIIGILLLPFLASNTKAEIFRVDDRNIKAFPYMIYEKPTGKPLVFNKDGVKCNIVFRSEASAGRYRDLQNKMEGGEWLEVMKNPQFDSNFRFGRGGGSYILAQWNLGNLPSKIKTQPKILQKDRLKQLIGVVNEVTHEGLPSPSKDGEITYELNPKGMDGMLAVIIKYGKYAFHILINAKNDKIIKMVIYQNGEQFFELSEQGKYFISANEDVTDPTDPIISQSSMIAHTVLSLCR